MAERAGPLGPFGPLAALSGAAVLALTLGTLGLVGWQAGSMGGLKGHDGPIIWFTIWQAGLSALISVTLAVPAARALARRNFAGRRLFITLLGAPFILPVIVAVLGLIAVYGRSGLISDAAQAVGLPGISPYGAHGVILANVFFNLPLAVRLLLLGWQSIPEERFRLTRHLGLSPRQIRRTLEYPMLREVVPGAALAIFLICLSSFAIALTLGGGPRATTVELAIYQAFRLEFDLSRAALLGLVQIAVTTLGVILSLLVVRSAGFGAGLGRPPVARGPRGRGLDAGVLILLAAFLLPPLILLILKGAAMLPNLPLPVWEAALRSVLMALAATFLCLTMALSMGIAAAERSQIAPWVQVAVMLPLAASPLVIGVGLFIGLRGVASPRDLALGVTVVTNALMALPFAFRILWPAIHAARHDFGRLGAALGLDPWQRLIHVYRPRLRQPLGFAAGVSAALSMGDLGVITLFGDAERGTLPLMVFRLMGAYRMDAAFGAAVLLLLLSLGLFWIFDRGGQRAET